MLKIYRILILTAVSGSALALASGCGQRGPLYLPEDAPASALVEPALPADLAPAAIEIEPGETPASPVGSAS